MIRKRLLLSSSNCLADSVIVKLFNTAILLFIFPLFPFFVILISFPFHISILKVLFYIIGWLASPLLLLTAILLIGLKYDHYSDDGDDDEAEDDDIRQEPTFFTFKLVMSSLCNHLPLQV